MDWSKFFEAFWPNFASTVLGLVLGVPFGLWLNRLFLGHAERVRAVAERQQLARSIETLLDSLSSNRNKLDAYVGRLRSQRMGIETYLDIATWEAVKPTIVNYLDDPKLQGFLAYHFLMLQRLINHNNLYLDHLIGSAYSLTDNEQTRAALRSLVLTLAANLEVETRQLISALQSKHEQIVTTIRAPLFTSQPG